MKLSGAAAIVTGGGSGLGRATAEALAAKGARVAIFDLNPAAAEEAAKAVGGPAIVGDVADEASAAGGIAKAARGAWAGADFGQLRRHRRRQTGRRP